MTPDDATATRRAGGRTRHDVAVRATRRRRPIDVKLLLASLGIAIGAVLIGYALLTAETGSDVDDLPDAIERIEPVNRATQVFAGSQVVVDLESGFTGRLTIDGQAIETVPADDIVPEDPDPGAQVSIPTGIAVFDLGNATLTYTPGEGAPVESFEDGQHTVRVEYWRIEEGPGRAAVFTWTFDAV